MKGQIFFFLFLMGAGSALAQDYQKARPKRFSKLIVGLASTPEYLLCKDEAPANDRYEYEYHNKFSYGFGVDLWYSVNDDFFIQGGVYQSFRKYYRKEVCYDCANGFNYESDFRLHYLDVPIGIAYKIVNSRLDFIAQGSIVSSFLQKVLENRNSITGSLYDYNIKSEYHKFLPGFMVGLGTNYNLTYRVSLGLQVNYKMYFMQPTDVIPMRWRGVSSVTGIYYKF